MELRLFIRQVFNATDPHAMIMYPHIPNAGLRFSGCGTLTHGCVVWGRCVCVSVCFVSSYPCGGWFCVYTVVCSPMSYVVLCVSCPGTRGGGGTTARVGGWCVAGVWTVRCVVYSCIQKGKKVRTVHRDLLLFSCN